MKENGIITRFLGTIFQWILILAFLFGEGAGIYHSFKHHGVRDGLVAVFIPPYSWYRSVDFIFWLGKGGLTSVEKEELKHFFNSMKAVQESFDILAKELSSPGIVGTIEEESSQRIRWLLNDGLKEAQNVRDDVLRKLHPELPIHFRDEFCEGVRLCIDGRDDVDAQMQMKGQWLLDQWGAWYNDNIEEIRSKYAGKRIITKASKGYSKKQEAIRFSESDLPRINEKELEEILPILMRSANEVLSEKDIEKVHEIYMNYFNRIDRENAGALSEFYLTNLEIPAEYNFEFNQCILNSFNSKKPSISKKLENLRDKMEMFGYADSPKLDNDIGIIRAAGNNTIWMDTFGQEQDPFTLKEILSRISNSEIMLKNFKRLSEKFKEDI